MTDTLFAVDRAADAALTLAGERSWSQVSLLDIARAAGVPLAELYAGARQGGADRPAVARYDEVALAVAEDEADADPHDRLFEAAMAPARGDGAHRHALIAIVRGEGPGPALRRVPRTARALLESAGIDAGGPQGALRLAAMTVVWGRVLQVWRDDEGALNRTMAELDARLKTMRRRLQRLAAGF